MSFSNDSPDIRQWMGGVLREGGPTLDRVTSVSVAHPSKAISMPVVRNLLTCAFLGFRGYKLLN